MTQSLGFFFRLVIIAVIGLMVTFTAVAQTVVIGVRAHNGVERAQQRWQPTIDFLQREIPDYQFQLKAIDDITRMEIEVHDGVLDFVLTQPLAYVDLERMYGVTRLLTLVKQNGLSQYGSVIFTRSEREDIQALEDAAGLSIAAVAPKGFGGWLIGFHEFTLQGIDSIDDFAEVSFLGSQNRVVMSVLAGEYDIGIVRTGILENMQKVGMLNLSRIKVLNPKRVDGFPFLLSSELYPEWAFARTRKVDSALAKRVATSLLTIKKDSVEAMKGDYSEWGIPLDYSSVHELMKQLHVGTYADFGEENVLHFILRHKLLTFGILLLMALTMAGFFKVRYSNRLLMEETQAKQQALRDLEHMAKYDALTDLPNRYLINELIQNQFHLSRRNKTRTAILFIDLDNFKTINDHYGHKVGDEVLKRTGQIIKSVIRRSDLCGRLGGDEFIVSMHSVTDREGVRVAAEKMINLVEDMDVLEGRSQKVSASIGALIVAPLDMDKTIDVSILISIADKLMYQAKTAGKRRVIIEDYKTG